MRRTALLALAPVLALAVACGSSSSPSSSGTTSELPTASGSYGDKPKLSFPAGKPNGKLQTKVLSSGDGPVVNNGDLLAFDYLGQVWDGKVFDNSYDRKVPLVTPIGAGQLIPAWDKELPGKTVGSRILLSVPPEDGYGASGNSQSAATPTMAPHPDGHKHDPPNGQVTHDNRHNTHSAQEVLCPPSSNQVRDFPS